MAKPLATNPHPDLDGFFEQCVARMGIFSVQCNHSRVALVFAHSGVPCPQWVIDLLGEVKLKRAFVLQATHSVDPLHGETWDFEIQFDPNQVLVGGIQPQSVNFMVQAQATLMMNPLKGFAYPNIHFDEVIGTPLEDGGLLIEPIVGWRDFTLLDEDVQEPTLMSRNGATWPTYKPLTATCGLDILAQAHDAPDERCQCGIYAFDTADNTDMRRTLLWGEVSLWGSVLVCETGWRAEFAYPRKLWLRNPRSLKIYRTLAKSIQEEYGVPVEVIEPTEEESSLPQS